MPETNGTITVFKLMQELLKKYHMRDIDNAYCLVSGCPSGRQDVTCMGPRICMYEYHTEEQGVKIMQRIKHTLEGRRVLFVERKQKGSYKKKTLEGKEGNKEC